MKSIDNIRDRIDKLPKGYIFTYLDFIDKVGSADTIIKSLNRLTENGIILKLSKGKFYKPEVSTFGNLKPGIKEIVKDLITKNGKTIGYITGYSIYNSMGLSTQVSNIIQIGSNNPKSATKRAGYKISFVQQKNTINKDNIKYLQLLDCIKYIKNIPDANIVDSINKLMVFIRSIDNDEANTLIKLSIKYPPATRALLGAILEKLDLGIDFLTIKNTLNPVSRYTFPGAVEVFGADNKWNIR